MRMSELVKCADCALCGRKIGESPLPLFWRVRVERYGIDLNVVRRAAGLEMMMGSPALAAVLGPDEEAARQLIDPVEVTLCDMCGTGREVNIAELGLREEKE